MKPIEWLRTNKYRCVVVLDKEGWKKKRWDVDISEVEFLNRLYRSSCLGLTSVYKNDINFVESRG